MIDLWFYLDWLLFGKQTAKTERAIRVLEKYNHCRYERELDGKGLER